MSAVITQSIEHVHTYQEQLLSLEKGHYIERVFYFITQVDINKASETLTRFVPAIPLTLNAIITGVILSLLLSTLLNLLYLGVKNY